MGKEPGKSLDEWRKEYEDFSIATSNINRSLALGGIAIVWIFRNPDGDGVPILPRPLIFPALLLSLSLFFDLLHYFVGTLIWYRFYLYHEKRSQRKKRKNLSAPPHKRKVISYFFYVKVALMLAAYAFLFRYLVTRIQN